MDCKATRNLLFRKLDNEISPSEDAQLSSHLAVCSSCAREMALLKLPGRIARAIPALEPSPYFYRKLKARIESEQQSVTLWQIMLGLSRQVVPALAVITLALLSIFAYYQFTEIRGEVYWAYDRIFTSGDRPTRMVIADPNEITDESVLLAISERDNPPSIGPQNTGKK